MEFLEKVKSFFASAGVILGVVCVVGLVLTFLLWWNWGDRPFYPFTKRELMITVTEKTEKGKRFIVWARVQGQGEQVQMFENTDTSWWWKHYSGDVQGNLEPGKTYRVAVAGWRSSWYSQCPNILWIVP